ncbi:hypothetical protein MSAR_09370 [Mycolicibacterium sarraceniae]|uniref:Uncharacterized protein n=1 Tax=Mycolicibacterium sarraceniae TaxID=1534348 RepID=A0A7I7SMZ1_9MYCO|nr:hypothetical protein MSAR_09370 [Mycolicibacterium sarraceniae]
MDKHVAIGTAAVGAAAALAVVGSGIASATNEYAGQTYADASQAISGAGQSATIATRVGSFLPTSSIPAVATPADGCCCT